ncbi:UDP-glycosyltransferase 73C1 [Linum perenne]
MLTWPLFGDQFCNERLVVDVLKIGVGIGAKNTMTWGEEEDIGVLVTKEDVKKGIDEMMGEGKEREMRMKRVKELSKKSKLALQSGKSQLYIHIHIRVTNYSKFYQSHITSLARFMALHFVLTPFMAQGHLIPMIDIAKLLAQHDVVVTVITTPVNADRVRSTLTRAINSSGAQISVKEVEFPCEKLGLPKSCENLDQLPSLGLAGNFMDKGDKFLQRAVEKIFKELRPSCIIASQAMHWTTEIAARLKIPRLIFDGTSCFTLSCSHNLHVSKVYEEVSESERFVVPGLPHRVEFTRAQLSGLFNPGAHLDVSEIREKITESVDKAYGVVLNSFEELEPDYVTECRKIRGEKKIWCIGPASLCNTDELDKSERGNKPSSDESGCLRWLDSWPENSVIYACLGSLNRITPSQSAELALGLESTNRPFVWVIRGGYKKESGFESRVKNRGLLIRGWAPQVLILSHSSIGGFLTHCGWNSTLEGVAAGVPMVTWPQFAEQFYNEKLVVQVLGIGVRVGAEVVVHLGEEEKHGVQVRKERIKEAVEELMGGGEESEIRRRKAEELKALAVAAVGEGGSSFKSVGMLIEDVTKFGGDC